MLVRSTFQVSESPFFFRVFFFSSRFCLASCVVLQPSTSLVVSIICIQSAAAAAAGAALCVALLLMLLHLLAAAVRHRVPDGRTGCWFIESDSSVFFLFIQAQFTFNAPLGSTAALMGSIFLHPRPLRARAEGAAGGRQPAAEKPPLEDTSSIYIK